MARPFLSAEAWSQYRETLAKGLDHDAWAKVGDAYSYRAHMRRILERQTPQLTRDEELMVNSFLGTEFEARSAIDHLLGTLGGR